MADAAEEMVRRGWRVTVLTSRRGYDDPSVTYLSRETRSGVDVVRLPFCSFGKQSLIARILGGISFVAQATLRATFGRSVDVVLVSTSPPMAPLVAIVVSSLRRARIIFWVMDLNPDQVVALQQLAPRALVVRLLEWMNRRILRRAADVVVLDRFMADRIKAKVPVAQKLHVIPPWPLEDHLASVPHAENPFRANHGLDGKFVVMYSGNHGPTHPFTTILQAAARLRTESRLVFLFVGGGIGKREVEGSGLPNVRSLPYQPLSQLANSLSGADVHLVTMGDRVVGTVHPCKVYGAMAVARPILFLGPSESHVGDLLRTNPIGWTIHHGDVDGAVRLLSSFLEMSSAELFAKGQQGRRVIDSRLSKQALCGQLCDLIEKSPRK